MKEIFGQFIALFIFFVIFTPLERLFTLRKEQKVFRASWQTDIIHFMLNRFLTDVGSFIVIVALAISLRWLVNPNIQNFVSSQAGWLQFAEAILIANLGGYLAHRLAHTIPFW